MRFLSCCMDLNATDEQLDSPDSLLLADATGTASLNPYEMGEDLERAL